MVIIPKILVLLFIDASHVKKSGHRQTLKNGTCGNRTHDLEGGTPSLSPIVPWKRKSWIFPYINYRSYLLWPYIPKVVRPIPIGIEWVPWWKKWKFFHFGKKFSTSKKFSRKKNFIPKSHELEHSAEVEIFPLLVEKFPLWRNFVFGFWTLAFATFEPKYAKWKFFHFGGKFSTFKKFFFFLQNCKNWVILHRKVFSEKSEIFPLFPKTRKFGKFIYSGL